MSVYSAAMRMSLFVLQVRKEKYSTLYLHGTYGEIQYTEIQYTVYACMVHTVKYRAVYMHGTYGEVQYTVYAWYIR